MGGAAPEGGIVFPGRLPEAGVGGHAQVGRGCAVAGSRGSGEALAWVRGPGGRLGVGRRAEVGGCSVCVRQLAAHLHPAVPQSFHSLPCLSRPFPWESSVGSSCASARPPGQRAGACVEETNGLGSGGPAFRRGRE